MVGLRSGWLIVSFFVVTADLDHQLLCIFAVSSKEAVSTDRPSVTAKDGENSIQKEASEIDVGDIVFCRVQPSQLFYAHIVHNVRRHYVQRPHYSIGNIQGHTNGWCYMEHIFGILVDVLVFSDGQYYSRPHPKKLFEKVSALVEDDRWNATARDLCLPSRMPPV